jgi:phospholipid/cholesterol/gamma-HCH transport system permease protein
MESASLPIGRKPAPPPPPAAAAAKKSGDGMLDEAGALALFCLHAFKALPGSLRYFSEIMRLNAVITRRTTLLLFIMCGFLGLSASNFGFFFLRSIGASDFVGILPGLITPRQIAPQMFGYVFSGSVCCAIAAELGSARIQEEIDAYESQGIDTMKMLVGTRIFAVLLFVPLATGVAMLGNFCGSYLTIVVILHGNSATQFIDTFFSIFPAKSLFYCTISIGLVALQCALVSCFYGMTGKGAGVGPAAVGGAVARSLAVNLVLLHFVLSLVALMFYGGSLGIPIGD